MIVQGIDFNVGFWKSRTKKQFVSDSTLLKAYPQKDLGIIYDELFPKAKKETKDEGEGAE